MVRARNSQYFDSDCVKVYDHFGETVVQNVCTYEKVVIPWGFLEWLSFSAVLVAVSVICVNIAWVKNGVISNDSKRNV